MAVRLAGISFAPFTSAMSILQTYLGSAYASHPIRWVETPQSTRTADASVPAEKADKTADPDAGKPHSASGDVLDLSAEAKTAEAKKTDSLKDTDKAEQAGQREKSSSGKVLTAEEQKQVEELKSRDKEVRTHEAAHVAAGGPYVTGGPSYTYQTGPDGKKYAIGGEVGISTSAVEGDPDATIQKMQTVAAAALAPAEPSGQDRKVAAAARQEIAKARMEKADQSHSQSHEQTDAPASTLATGETEEAGDADKPAGEAEQSGAKRGEALSADKPAHTAVSAFSAAAAAYKNHSSVSYQSVMPLSSPGFAVFA
ncbi:MAG: hypothetical protein LBT46_12260 [Planctomycetaceae bacterium]|jgi:hypothetical protein|nr:hypothetical protein [Planctomycetaceae bacterium]